MNSDLVKITNDQEYTFLLNRVKGHRYYVGLSDQQEEGTFRWVADGTIHSTVRSWWKEGEPNNCKDAQTALQEKTALITKPMAKVSLMSAVTCSSGTSVRNLPS
ncbi:hepatic lectin-like [Macrobrachium rosenbergii]|uniref:hepatic lectin-like n=1 Tax=Macrobrachium rosenbergii TaxID=79674 RepID=UPI0034D44037